MGRKVSLSGWEKAIAMATPEAALRRLRRWRMGKNISDEALYDLDEITRLLVSKRR
jgi:hypothetical protein